jgi:hypothetical protein
MSYVFVKVTTDRDWSDYHSLRREVLWVARGMTGMTRITVMNTFQHTIRRFWSACVVEVQPSNRAGTAWHTMT